MGNLNFQDKTKKKLFKRWVLHIFSTMFENICPECGRWKYGEHLVVKNVTLNEQQS